MGLSRRWWAIEGRLLILLFVYWPLSCSERVVGPAAHQLSGVTVGPLTIGAWLPFGVGRSDLALMTTDLESDLGLNQIEFFPRESIDPGAVDWLADSNRDEFSIEELAALLSNAMGWRCNYRFFMNPRVLVTTTSCRIGPLVISPMPLCALANRIRHSSIRCKASSGRCGRNMKH